MRLRAAAIAATVCCLAMVLAACGGDGGPRADSPPSGGDCNWPMWGQNLARTFSYPCQTDISPTTVSELGQRWFFNTADVVTATPAVVDGVVYVGDWSGTFYAIDAVAGTTIWTFKAPAAKHVYAGQIVSSAAVADVDGRRLVLFADGPVLYALNATDGSLGWKANIGTGGADDFTEIESSPVVADGKVVVGSDVHNHPGQKAGVYAFDVTDGRQVWYYDTDDGQAPSGCVDVWGSASVDTGRRAVYFGTGSCDTATVDWRPDSEALVAIDLDQGTRRWAYQPHDRSAADLDFAGAPNLFDAGGRALVGLGNKDGSYYALDRDDGSLVWKTQVTEGGPTGGFIGPTVYARGIIAGGTAVGGAPFAPRFERGRRIDPLAATESGGDVRGIDRSQRCAVQRWHRLHVPRRRLEDRGRALVPARRRGRGRRGCRRGRRRLLGGGPAGTGHDQRRRHERRVPLQPEPGRRRGRPRRHDGHRRRSDTTPPPVSGLALTNGPQPCIGSPCPMEFLKPKPAAAPDASATLEITANPFTVTVRASNLGNPDDWVTPGSDAAVAGATSFGVYISESDETLRGGLLCTLDANGSCTADTVPLLTTYSRITLLAVNGTSAFPTPSEGLARLVATTSFQPPLDPHKT